LSDQLACCIKNKSSSGPSFLVYCLVTMATRRSPQKPLLSPQKDILVADEEGGEEEESLIEETIDDVKKLEKKAYRMNNRSCSIIVIVTLMALIYMSMTCFLQQDDNNEILLQTGGLRTTGSKSSEDQQCTIWLAASSLKGHPGMGVFTTRDIRKASLVIPKGDGIAIPLYGVHRNTKEPNEKERSQMMEVWHDYIWSINKPDHISYEEFDGLSSYFPGYASLTNHHCTLQSLKQRYLPPFYDDSLVNRFQDPGAGAFSYDAGRGNYFTRDVEAGDELFLNYGYCEHGKAPEWGEHAFMPDDFLQAANVIFQLVWKSLRLEGDKMVYEPPKDLPISDDANDLVVQLLPKDAKELQEMRSVGGSMDDLIWYLARYKGLKHHETEWIQRNGICLENFAPGKSTIHQAGNGGIAQLHITKGDIVVPVPLLQVMDKEALAIYESADKGEKEFKEIGKQLLLNYCWGHSESRLLLCPQTNAVLLNHCSERTKECGSEGPNAEIRWASDWHTSTKSWLEMSLDQMAKETTGGLAFDIVALRDIKPSEEIFIDYGTEWERAWKDHVDSWKPAQSEAHVKDSWISAKEANDNREETLKKFTTNNLREVSSNHTYLFTGCHYWVDKQDEHEFYNQKNKNWTNFSDEDIIKTYADDGERYSKNHDKRYQFHRDHSFWPCQVLNRETEDTYTVRILQSPFEKDQPWKKNDVPRLLVNFSLQGIRFFVKPYKSDQHIKDAFRHPIGIPDEMFPEQWKTG